MHILDQFLFWNPNHNHYSQYDSMKNVCVEEEVWGVYARLGYALRWDVLEGPAP